MLHPARLSRARRTPNPKVNPLRRVLVLLSVLLLMMIGLTACGDDDGGGKSNDGSVKVTGTFGSEPKVAFKGEYKRTTTETTVLSEGDGDQVKVGDSVFANLYIANGFTGKQAASTWDEGSASLVKVSDDMLPGLKKAIDGQKVGSRVMVESTPKDAFGEAGNPNLFIDPSDSVVFVVDIVKVIPTSIDTSKATAPKGAPKVVEKDGAVTGLTFTGKPAKITKLETITLVKGTGPKAKKGSTLAVKYLGQVNGKKQVFDQNFTKGDPYSVTIGQGGTIQGWQEGLTGVTEGSRVILRIPSKLGYGKKGSAPKIKPGDDLVFVIDVLAVN